MRLSCPNCLTEYDVPDAAILGRTRSLRCAKCGSQWQSGAPAPAAPEPMLREPMPPEPMPPEPLPPEPITSETIAPEPISRTFGRPADQDAMAAVQVAARQEGSAPLNVTPPEPTTLAGMRDADLPRVAMPQRVGTSEDGFAELFRAARDRSYDPAPEPLPPEPPTRASSRPLVILLVILFIVGMVALEHGRIMHAVPASQGFFHALGFKS